jgi:hypothetical protein
MPLRQGNFWINLRADNFCHFFHRKSYELIMSKMFWATFWAIFCTKLSVHPGLHQVVCLAWFALEGHCKAF